MRLLKNTFNDIFNAQKVGKIMISWDGSCDNIHGSQGGSPRDTPETPRDKVSLEFPHIGYGASQPPWQGPPQGLSHEHL